MDGNQDISEREKAISIARLSTITGDFIFVDGSSGTSYSRDQMIGLIKGDDPAGIEYVKIEWEFLRALKSGEVMQAITSAA